MSKINESGIIQHYKVTPIDRLRYRIKANLIRFKANCYGLWWMLRNRR